MTIRQSPKFYRLKYSGIFPCIIFEKADSDPQNKLVTKTRINS